MRILLYAVTAFALSVAAPALAQTIDFGDDASEYARDGECDDKRFVGPGMTTTPLLDSDIGHDATDCRDAWEAGTLSLAEDGGRDDLPATEAGVDFGDDSSTYANDGECDDPRFEGPGMASPPLLQEDTGRDASDCLTAWQAGEIWLAGRSVNQRRGGSRL